MIDTIDPRIPYSQSSFFLDYIAGKDSASHCFQHSLASIDRLAQERTRVPSPQARNKLCDVLLNYNCKLNAPAKAIANIERLRAPEALCVIGGQQAEFLGGPLFVLYKIATIIQTAAWMSDHLSVPVVPVFWSASEDHDFAEINHTRWIDESDTLRTISFDWDGQGKPIEQLPITDAVRRAFEEACQKIPFSSLDTAALFAPEPNDDYSTWHARMWSRAFADHGLIMVEPRVLRPLATSFFARVLTDQGAIQEGLADGAERLQSHGYPVLLDPAKSGSLFTINAEGFRLRVEPTSSGDSADSALTYSTDAALRPLLADSLFPSIANILGPSEIAYHAMLRPLYEHWQVPQPLAIPRKGATLIPSKGLKQLADFGVLPSKAVEPSFKPSDVVKAAASDTLSSEFANAKGQLEEALIPLKETLSQLDPGLEVRWRQTVDQAQHQLDRLEDRAIRADLARRGLSVKNLQALKPLLHPMEKPQERILSGFSIIAKYGVEWIHDIIFSGEPSRFEHQLIVLKEPHE
jgi:bacillithiol synthase